MWGLDRTEPFIKNIAEYNYVNEVIIVKNSKTIDRCTSSLAIHS